MLFPARGVDIVNQLYNTHKDLAEGSDDQRRQLTRMMAEQMCFELGSLWGTKKAGPGNPQSKDSIAYKTGATTFDSWDWQNGTTRQPQVSANQPPSYPGLTLPQEFIEVSPTNHLEVGGPTEPPPQTGNEFEDEVLKYLAEIKSSIKLLYDTDREIADHVDRIGDQITVVALSCQQIVAKCDEILGKQITHPDYVTSVLGRSVTSKPKV